MQRSSKSIANLAAALAKAQAELVNPEKKSLVATIRADGPGSAERSFRYAPLSSGLDIVRKTLGQHMRSPPCRPPRWTRALASSISQLCWHTLPGNGSHRTGRSVPSAKPRPTSDGRGADLCPALCLVHAGRHCRGGRHRCAGSHGIDKPGLRVGEAEGGRPRSAERRATESISTRSSPPRRKASLEFSPSQSSNLRHRPNYAIGF